MTIYEEVTGWLYQQQRKHDLGDSYVEDYINSMSQYEFLEVISEAVESIRLDNLKGDLQK